MADEKHPIPEERDEPLKIAGAPADALTGLLKVESDGGPVKCASATSGNKGED